MKKIFIIISVIGLTSCSVTEETTMVECYYSNSTSLPFKIDSIKNTSQLLDSLVNVKVKNL